MFRLIAILLLLFPFVGSVDAAWKDPVHGFNLDVPQGWRVEEQNSKEARTVILLNRDETIAVGVISIDAGASLTLDQWIQAVEPMFLSDILSGGKRKKLSSHSINGLQGKYGHYTGPYKAENEVVPAVGRIFFTQRGTVGHFVWCVVSRRYSSTHLPQAEQVLATFSFGGTGKPRGGVLAGILGSSSPMQRPNQAGQKPQSVSPGDQANNNSILDSLKSDYGSPNSSEAENEAVTMAKQLYGIDYRQLVVKAANGNRDALKQLNSLRLKEIAGVIHDEVLYQLRQGLGDNHFTSATVGGNSGIPSTTTVASRQASSMPTKSDESHLIASAKKRFIFDLDGNGSNEQILAMPVGENEMGSFFSLKVLDANGGLMWSGPTTLQSDNPLMFGEWHHGISLPEVVGDIDGDGFIELVAPAPQGDVSPTTFRRIRWQQGTFQPTRPAMLLESPEGSGQFIWTRGDHYQGSWVQSFESINQQGEAKAGIMEYRGGADVKTYRAVLQRTRNGFSVKQRKADPHTSSDTSASVSKANIYRARLSNKDHVNSRGVRNTTVISILLQDRANYHRYKRRDAEDESDNHFSTSRDRIAMMRLQVRCAEQKCINRIINGRPLVEVKVNPDYLGLKILQD